ncbi:MAG: von Willebrand factor type A domain-containing protein [Planctomycetota bacterium]
MEDNHDMQELSAEDALHAALCALALGELAGDEAAALEARVAAEPELGAQYAEARATIALVRTSLAGGDALPPEHMERLLEGARQQAQPTPILHLAWYRQPAVRLAASLVLLAGAGFVGLRLVDQGQRAADDSSARLLERSSNAGAAVAGVPAHEPADELAVDPAEVKASRAELEPLMEAAARDAYVRRLTAGEIRQNGQPKYVDPDAETVAVDGFVDHSASPTSEPVPAPDASALAALGYASDAVTEREQVLAQRALGDVTNGHEEVAALGLNLGEAQGESKNAAGVPNARFFFEAGELAAAPKAGEETHFAGVVTSTGRSGPSSPGPGGAPARRVAPSAPSTPNAGSAPNPPVPPGAPRPAQAPPTSTTPLGGGGGAGGVLAGPQPSDSRSQAAPEALAPEQPLAAPAPVREERLRKRSAVTAASEPRDAVSDELALGRVGASREAAPATDRGRGKQAKDEGPDEMTRAIGGFSPGSPLPRLSDEQLELMVDQEWARFHRDCQLRPNERPRDMYFRFWGDNAFVATAQDAQSTFGADVDTASYALARRYLREGQRPERAQIRTEEFVNAFTPDLVPPSEETFALSLELAPTPFGEDANHWLLRVGVRGKEVAKDQREPLNLTFVVDTSGSMREGDRLELVKHAMRLLVTQLDARDTIAIVAYSNEARQVLGATSAARRDLIESAIQPLSPNGSTNAEAGLRMGYAMAETMLASGTYNRVVFLSDGVANMGQTDQDRINGDVKRFRDAGIYLNTIGVGMNNHNDAFLEQLANKGDGICDYVDDAKAAQKAIVERFTGAFVPIASDVKLQVEFDPAQVLRWRQLGYENRAIADRDFRNDKVDAGEVGAGHQVTCLYEVELAPDLSKQDLRRALATLRVRWKAPKQARQDVNEVDVFERETALDYGLAAGSFQAASLGFRRAALAAEFAEVLRRSSHARFDSYAALVSELGALMDASSRGGEQKVIEELVELADLVRRADALGFGRAVPVTNLERTIDEYRRFQYLRATLEELERDQDPLLQQIEDTNRTLEQQIRDALMRDLRERHG